MNAVEIRPMTRQLAEEIAVWDFGENYRFYNIEGDPFVIEEFQNGHYYAVFCNESLAAFFCDGETATVDAPYDDIHNCIDIGLALRPDMTSQGYGSQLIALILEFYQQLYLVEYFRLTVAAINQRAVKLYESTGFRQVKQFEVVEGNEKMLFYVMMMEVPS
ncbi:GNAT family N-acetyltransferase [Macrococcus lamae]|uniref:N-acetyltransferase n=1 Tax=Macrococcus lamae TaxID=198484 RepID=A0A4R6BX28_9STAP|nr:N-acetyltransferase [Macrococcus lamae]TDM13031.1 N-acetyltransferase [Macrococcus lamae]